MSKSEVNILQKKFRGVFMGLLTGDCLGGPFEGDPYRSSAKITAKNYFDAMLNEKNLNLPYKNYNANFSATKAITKSLLMQKDLHFDFKDLAKNLAIEYQNSKMRNYDSESIKVFENWSKTAFEDVFKSSDEVKGQGGWGAGKISPIALFYTNKDTQEMLEMVKKIVRLTHSDEIAINGAIIQALALKQALDLNPQTLKASTSSFLENLILETSKIETKHTGIGLANKPFFNQLMIIKDVLDLEVFDKDQHKQDLTVVKRLGNTQNALHCVPTSIYCFLRAQNKIERVNSENDAIGAIQYAITLGGATNLIASLVGAIAGACFTEAAFPNNLILHLEEPHLAINLADELYKAYLTK